MSLDISQTELPYIRASLLADSLSPATCRAYRVGHRAFINFCGKWNRNPLPASMDTITLFISHLRSLNLAYKSTKLYLAAVANLHVENNLPSDVISAPGIIRVMRGYKRQVGVTRRTKTAITIDVLRKLKNSIASSDFKLQDQRMLWCASTTAFYGLLRVSEFTSPGARSFDPATTLCFTDVNIHHDSIQLFIKSSKCDPYRHGTSVLIGSSGTSICPVRAMRKYLQTYNSEPNSPLFMFQSGIYLTRQRFNVLLKYLLHPCVPNSRLFSSHSFRRGCASSLAAKNISSETIQMAGRWRSSAYQEYLATNASTLLSLAAQLSN
jgi:hypothetical protein